MAAPKSGLLKQHLSHEQVINRSGFEIRNQGVLPPLRKGYYYTVLIADLNSPMEYAMISTLKKILFRQDGQKHLRTPQDETAEFLVQHRNLDVGYLTLQGGKWHFEYTDTFRKKKDAYPIINFPHLDKHYESDVLWPFFVIRIPGLGQPAVQRVIREENIDPSNEVQLLKRFGKNTIANPFILLSKDAQDET